jgi:hypothetical protein
MYEDFWKEMLVGFINLLTCFTIAFFVVASELILFGYIYPGILVLILGDGLQYEQTIISFSDTIFWIIIVSGGVGIPLSIFFFFEAVYLFYFKIFFYFYERCSEKILDFLPFFFFFSLFLFFCFQIMMK